MRPLLSSRVFEEPDKSFRELTATFASDITAKCRASTANTGSCGKRLSRVCRHLHSLFESSQTAQRATEEMAGNLLPRASVSHDSDRSRRSSYCVYNRIHMRMAVSTSARVAVYTASHG